jgi:hypothetical protein
MSALIGALAYERTVDQSGSRNGSYTRDLETSAGLIKDVQVPRTSAMAIRCSSLPSTGTVGSNWTK